MGNDVAITIAPPATDQLTGITPAENKEWRNTGKLPERVAKESPEPTSEATPQEEKPAAEAGAAQETVPSRKSKTAERFEVLTSHNRELKTSNEAKDREIAELRAQLAGKSPSGASSAATPAATQPELPKKPDINEYDGTPGKTYEDYTEALADWKVEVKLAQRDAQRQEQEQKSKRESAGKSLEEGWRKKAEEATKKYPDFKAHVENPETPMTRSPVAELFYKKDPLGAEVAYHLATHREELDRINAMQDEFGNPDVFAQHEEFINIRNSLKAQAPPVAPAKKLTEAPPPVREVGSGATPPKDELESLVSKTDPGSVRAYLRAANQRDIARKRG